MKLTFKITYKDDDSRHSVRLGAESKEEARERFKRLYKEVTIVSVVQSEREMSEIRLGKFIPKRNDK